MKKGIVYIDLFSGCGGFSLGLQQAGIEFAAHLYSEIDPYKITVYRRHFPRAINLGDINGTKRIIRQIMQIKTAETRPLVATFGWPCQDISILGKSGGLVAGPRSSLFFKAIEILKKVQPHCFIAENIERLRSSTNGTDIVAAITRMSQLRRGRTQHKIEMQLFDSRYYTAQSRRRLYFVGYPPGQSTGKVFPIFPQNEFLIAKTADTGRKKLACQKASYGRSGVMHEDTVIQELDGRKRGMTPVEAERGQGFPDHWTAHGIDETGEKKEISDSQRFIMLGDAVTVPVVTEIARKMKKAELL